MTVLSFKYDRFCSAGSASRAQRRASTALGFTLIELLVTVTIIGVLAGLFLGALSRATLQANVVNTKSTIAKLNTTIMQYWESYRNRAVPIDPRTLLTSPAPNQLQQSQNAYAFCLWLASRTNDPALQIPPNDPLGRFPTTKQLNAVRLLALRELQMYEMPASFDDFAIFTNPSTGNPNVPPYSVRPPVVLPAPAPLAYAYLAKLNAAFSADPSQLEANGAAECLYMIMSTGAQDDALLGDHMRPDDIGDVDADGLPEFQDAWPETSLDFTFTTFPNNQPPPATVQVLNTRKTNKPISWIRWPAGFISDLQPDPTMPPYADGSLSATGQPLPAIPAYQRPYEFSIWRHDIFDPLKLDVPPPQGTGNPPPPRGYQLFPLVYSAGPDGLYELAQNTGFSTVTVTIPGVGQATYTFPDPYSYSPTSNNPLGQSGSWQDSPSGPYADGQDESLDNITNHAIGTSARQ